jgi:CheY-like chemotaxis protein
MQKTSVNSPLTLSQRIYVIARSLRTLGNWLRLLLIINLVFLSLGWAQAIYGFDIGCFCIHRDYSYYLFIYLELSLMTVYLLVYFLSKGPSTYKKLKEWNEDYLDETYTIVFDMTVPKGSTTGERVFNLARAIFPELTSDYVRLAAGIQDRIKLYFKKKLGRLEPVNISQGLNYKVNPDYSVGLALKLPLEGYFIVKDFKEKVVNLDDLKYLVKTLEPEAALSNFKAGKYDIALIDIKMPQMNGFDLCEKLRNIDDKVKFYFMTAYEGYYETLKKDPTLNVDYFMTKPIQLGNLVAVIKGKLEKLEKSIGYVTRSLSVLVR